MHAGELPHGQGRLDCTAASASQLHDGPSIGCSLTRDAPAVGGRVRRGRKGTLTRWQSRCEAHGSASRRGPEAIQPHCTSAAPMRGPSTRSHGPRAQTHRCPTTRDCVPYDIDSSGLEVTVSTHWLPGLTVGSSVGYLADARVTQVARLRRQVPLPPGEGSRAGWRGPGARHSDDGGR